MSPMGKLEKPAKDLAQTDPAALISASVTESTGEMAQVQVGSSQDAAAKAANTWPSVSEKDNVASHDEKPVDVDAFENLNIENILDDAAVFGDGLVKRRVHPIERVVHLLHGANVLEITLVELHDHR